MKSPIRDTIPLWVGTFMLFLIPWAYDCGPWIGIMFQIIVLISMLIMFNRQLPT